MTKAAPRHDSIDPEIVEVVNGSTISRSARVRCPVCLSERLMELNYIRARMKLGGFTGRCARCATKQIDYAARAWGVGRSLTSAGYVSILTDRGVEPGDRQLLYDTIMWTGQKYVLEHNFLMVKHLGRQLFEDERVKHRDGVRTNNKLENLELYSNGVNATERVADLLAWGEEIVRRYGALKDSAVLGKQTPP